MFASKKNVPCGEDGSDEFSFTDLLRTAKLSLEGQTALARQTAAFFKSHYGVGFKNFSFSDFSKNSFDLAAPHNVSVTEEASKLFGIVTCEGSNCYENGENITII